MTDPAVLRPPAALSPEGLREVLDTLDEGIAILGPDGIVDYMNPSGERILNLQPGEMLGCRLLDFRWEIVDLEGAELARESLATLRAMETGEPGGPVVVGMTSNAVPELAWVEVSTRALRGTGARPPYATVTTFRQVTDRVRAEQALRESEKRYETLTQSVPVGIFHSDLEGRAVWVNDAMAGIVGLSFEESQGMGWAATLHPDDRDGVFGAFMHAAVTGEPYAREHRYLHRDGKVRWVICRAAPQLDAQGRTVGWVGSVTDVTEAKSAAVLKDRIIGHVSHELRAPLISIRGGLGFLAPHFEGAGEEARRFYHMALRNADLLERLVRDLLDIERLQAGQAGLEMAPVAVSDLLGEAVGVVLSQAEARGVVLRDAPAGTLRVTGDRDRLLQVFTNLLSNAVKFSEEGGAVWTDVAGSEGTVTIGVHDRGRGIAAEDHARIFEPFHQVGAERGARPEGAGLGLAIARAIVDQHGGRIRVESSPGQGASFFVTLPASSA